MSHEKTWRGVAATVVAASTLMSVGCAQDIGDINRVQPNALEKADFQTNKQWYSRQMVADTDLQGSVIFQGLMSSLKRVRWVITEETLFACSTVPPVLGERAETSEIEGEECYGVVAAYPISGHFDIQRQYNTATGEQTNVIVENTSDRPWYDREYFRVEWGQNMVDGYGMYSNLFGSLSAVEWTPDQDPGEVSPFRTRIKPEEGYIEATSAYNFTPDLYACYGIAGQIGTNCDSGRVIMRTSFLEVPEEKTFEPFQHLDNEYVLDDESGQPLMTTGVLDSGTSQFVDVECDAEVKDFLLEEYGDFDTDRCRPLTFDYFGRFGYFRTELMEFDENYAASEFGRRYYANHFNIWQTAYGEDGELLDMTERKPKPIVYHLNPEYPRDMIPAAQEVEREWNRVFKNAVLVAKQSEDYNSVEDVEQELGDLYDGDTRMFKIEPNGCMPNMVAQWYEANSDARAEDVMNVEEIVTKWAEKSDASGSLEDKLWGVSIDGRKQMCAELEFATEARPEESRFVWQREGDLRYSFFSWVEENVSGWLGYGPSAADPLTGEIISGGAHIAGAAIRTSSAYAADLVRYMNGELTEDELLYANHVREYVQNTQESIANTRQQELNQSGKIKVNRTNNVDFDREGLQSPSFEGSNPTAAELPEIFRARGLTYVKNEAARNVKASIDATKEDTRFADFMAMPEVKSLMMADPNMSDTVTAMAHERALDGEVTDEDKQLAYLSLNAPMLNYWRDETRLKTFAERNMLMATDITRAINTLVTYRGVADRFKGMPREEIANYFKQKMTVGTQLHEVGHAVGLRHNFNASMDALNYHPEFWKIQEAVAKGIIRPDQAASVPADKVQEVLGDTYDDSENYEYLNEAEFRLASVMDYTGDLTGRFAGLGKYDQASINFVYAKKVQVWEDEVAQNLPNGIDYDLFVNAGFDKIPLIFSGMPATESDETRFLKGVDNILNGRKWVSIQRAKDNLRQGVKTNTTNFNAGEFSPSVRPYQEMTIPYNFCTDDRADYDLGCDVFDWGSSHREIVNHQFNTYRLLQPFYRSKRQRLHRYGETINGYYSFLLRTLNVAARPFRYFSIYRIWDLGDYTDDLREAAIDAINFYNEVMAMPEPGIYAKALDPNDLRINKDYYRDVSNTYMPSNFVIGGSDADDTITIRPGAGQYYNYDLTDEYGFRINYVGTFIDKLVASQAMFFISATYLFNSFLTDSRATNLSFWTLFRDQMLGQLRGVILNDYTEFGGIYSAIGAQQGNYTPPIMVDRDAYTYGLAHPQEGKPRIFTSLSFNHEFNMLAYALIANSTYADRSVDFAQYIRVAVGDRIPQDFGDAEIAEFVNPETGQRYVAPQTADGESITVEMVNWANELKDIWLDAQEDEQQKLARFDQLREAYDTNFDPRSCEDDSLTDADLELDAVCDAMQQFRDAQGYENRRSEQLQDVIAKIELVRWLWGILGPDARN